MKYKTIVIKDRLLCNAQKSIEQEVNRLLEDGWNLQGGLSVNEAWEIRTDFPSSSYFTLAQAMIKED